MNSAITPYLVLLIALVFRAGASALLLPERIYAEKENSAMALAVVFVEACLVGAWSFWRLMW